MRNHFDPCTIDEWIQKSNAKVDDTNPPVTLLLDLDETIISQDNPLSLHSLQVFVNDLAFYVDLDAIEAIKRIVNNGHNLKIITDAGYSYDDVNQVL
ncbi:hypothetical protein [Parashewanella hymeniacidonis]|uniref:hypothetical protein n=1 Tax=Parashewanella hymeniacidonis TaxID=2807618 RepID=UPI001960A02D|nr:hypothetical protein [Parashewanella hymeniacidonis]